MRRLIPATAFLCLSVSVMAAEDTKRAADCEARVLKAQKGGFIQKMFVNSSGVNVVVDSAAWKLIDYTVKVGMAETIACVITKGDSSKTVNIVVRDNMTNKIIAEGYPSRFEVK